MLNNMVVMGRIVAPYGIYGWIKVVPDTANIDSLLAYPHWWLGKQEQWREYKVENARIHNDLLLAKLVGLDNRDLAFSSKGQFIAVPSETLPKAEDDEFYWSDLIGLEVSNKQGVSFGKVSQVFATGANDVLVVNSDPAQVNAERLIPFIAQTIITVDLEASKILVDWDAGF